MKLTSERLWWLQQFGGAGGWTMGRPMSAGLKKWRAHSAALVKMGLLERYGDALDGDLMHRITDAGRAALDPKP